MTLSNELYTKLQILEPLELKIEDESAKHAGHAGNSGGGHYNIYIVSSQFSAKSQIMRHRLIYQALTDFFPNKIHALSIRAFAPDELNL